MGRRGNGRLGAPDANLPTPQVRIAYGADAYSLQMTGALLAMSSSYSPANIGIGVQEPMPGASFSRLTKNDAWFPPMQNFVGMRSNITTPSVPNFRKSGSLPSGNQNIDPTLLAWTPSTWDGVGNWTGSNGVSG